MPWRNTHNVSGLSCAGRVGGVMAPVFGKVFVAARQLPWPAQTPEAKSQGKGPRKGQELNIHKKKQRSAGSEKGKIRVVRFLHRLHLMYL